MFMGLCILGELPQNCKEVKRLKGAGEDGEYFLIVTGKLLKVLVRAQSSFLRCFRASSLGCHGPVSQPPLAGFVWSVFQVFCAGMHSDHPKEYVTLVHGDSENFSEVYGHR